MDMGMSLSLPLMMKLVATARGNSVVPMTFSIILLAWSGGRAPVWDMADASSSARSVISLTFAILSSMGSL